MNYNIKAQTENMIAITKAFKQGCKIAALKNDGKIDREEAKLLKEINKASEKYEAELKRIIQHHQ